MIFIQCYLFEETSNPDAFAYFELHFESLFLPCVAFFYRTSPIELELPARGTHS